ncbi:hypothetical protein Hanom_Chr03g00203831 [Helianthus anomalus]
MNGQDLVGADEDNDGGFEVTARVYKQEEHRPPDLGFLEGLVVWQGFQQLRGRSTCFQTGHKIPTFRFQSATQLFKFNRQLEVFTLGWIPDFDLSDLRFGVLSWFNPHSLLVLWCSIPYSVCCSIPRLVFIGCSIHLQWSACFM